MDRCTYRYNSSSTVQTVLVVLIVVSIALRMIARVASLNPSKFLTTYVLHEFAESWCAHLSPLFSPYVNCTANVFIFRKGQASPTGPVGTY